MADACLCNDFEQWKTAVDKRLNGKYKNTLKWINLCQFKHKLVWNCSEGLKIFFCLHKRFTSVVHCTSVESTLVQPKNRRLWNRRINGCTKVDSTVVQTSIRRFPKRRMDGYIDYFKRIIKIFICPFGATVHNQLKFNYKVL